MEEVTLDEMLNAREQRVFTQMKLTQTYSLPVISFTMNIAGPIKNNNLIERSFLDGLSHLKNQLKKEQIVHLIVDADAKTGPFAFLVVNKDLLQLKKITVMLEDKLPMGRLYDMDVIDVTGQKVDRSTVGAKERNCLVCGKEGRGCASRRVHSVSELQDVTKKLIVDSLFEQDKEKIANLAVNSLIEEVLVTPKPGLVDFNNCGSHPDMDYHLFIQSALSLSDYYKKCFEIGVNTQNLSSLEVFALLREEGMKAELAMFTATKGVNTHKGAIFSLGVVIAAIGRIYQGDRIQFNAQEISDSVKELANEEMNIELNSIKQYGDSHGISIYREYKIEGIRGELRDGLPHVLEVLPVFEELVKTKSINDALAMTLIHLVALVDDTTLISRGGYETAMKMKQKIKQQIQENAIDLKRLDEEFISRNLSVGGCADLLAIVWFIWKMRSIS